jgi:hypothetical protein
VANPVTITPDPVTITPDTHGTGGAGGGWDDQQPLSRVQEILQGLKRAGIGLTKGTWQESQARSPQEQAEMDKVAAYTTPIVSHGIALINHMGDDIWEQTGEASKAFLSKPPETEGGGWAGSVLGGLEKMPLVGSMVQHAEKGGPHMFSAPSLGATAEGTGYAVAPRVAGKVIGKVAQVPGDISAIRSVVKASGDSPFRVGLQAITHDILNKAADTGKQKLWDAHAKVSARVGGLKNDIANADYQAGPPAIAAADLIPKIDELATRYKAAGTPLPKFDAAVRSIVDRGNPYLSFEEAADLRSEVGSLSARAAEGTRDAGAIGELEQALKSKLSARATELGHAKTFNDYNGLWRTLKQYEGSGPMGQLLNSGSGFDFFKTLNDPSSMSALNRTIDSLSDFGLDKGFASKLKTDHGSLYDYAKSSGGPVGFTGRFRSLMRHPVTAGLGGVVGKAAFGWPGGVVGTVGAGDIADAIQASRQIQKLGGPPDVTGEMKSFTSQPSGQPVVRPEMGDPQLQADLISALRHQGMDAKGAKAAAIRAIQANPKGDLPALFSDALRRPE